MLAIVALISGGQLGRWPVSWFGWWSSLAAALGISLLVGVVNWRVGQPSSSLSPDLAIRYPTARSARG